MQAGSRFFLPCAAASFRPRAQVRIRVFLKFGDSTACHVCLSNHHMSLSIYVANTTQSIIVAGLGPVYAKSDIISTKRAKFSEPGNIASSLSERVQMRRQPLRLRNSRSTTFRSVNAHPITPLWVPECAPARSGFSDGVEAGRLSDDVPLFECERAARHQMPLRKQPLARRPRSEGLSHRSRLTKKMECSLLGPEY